MGTTLFMAHQHMLQPAPGFRLVQFVVDRQDGAAGIAEDILDAMQMQGVHQGITTIDPLGHSAPHRHRLVPQGLGQAGIGADNRGGDWCKRHGGEGAVVPKKAAAY
jgi:hypothetical protein